VLIYDLRNVAKDQNSQRRIGATTDELYISEPYFSAAEAARIKTTKVDIPEELDVPAQNSTVEEAITTRLANFFEKRKASGDSRPCGPHDMAPVYQWVFGIDKEELEDDNFLSRLGRF